MSIDTRAQLEQAYNLIKSGQKAEALQLITPVLNTQPNIAEAWWLAANAASNDQDAVLACERVLALKPTYQPAQQLLTERKLKQAAALLEAYDKAGALAILKPLLEQTKDNPVAWWLLAQASPSSVDAAQACQQVLRLQPDHVQAREKLIELQSVTQQRLSQKFALRDKRTTKRKTNLWVTFGLLGLLFFVLTGAVIVILITGSNLGLPIGGVFSSSFKLGTLGKDPKMQLNSIVVGAKHEYTFQANGGTHIVVMVYFANYNSDQLRKYVRLYDPRNNSVALPVTVENTGHKVAQIEAVLPQNGAYTLVINGAAGVAQGGYVMQLINLSEPGGFNK